MRAKAATGAIPRIHLAMPSPSLPHDRRPALRRPAWPAPAVLAAAMATPQAAMAAEAGLGAVAVFTLGAVAVALGVLAAALAYRLGRAGRAAAAPPAPAAAAAPEEAAAPAAPRAAEPAEAAPRDEAESFGFTLSHDLRAPLRVVEGFTRIVKEDYGPHLDRVGNDHLDRVLGAAARMNLMIDAMLALARLSQQPLARQPVDLSQLAAFVVEDLRRASPDRAVAVEIEPGLQAQGDPTLLRLVLDNLLGNAWKYTAKASHPRIELRREATVDAPGLGFVVRDNGAGFDMRSADRLFGLFQRLHSASDFPGHGVGLASVRRVVERHGGRVWADSEAGRGASFHVVLGPG
jgi:signal transduction histidine kinase